MKLQHLLSGGAWSYWSPHDPSGGYPAYNEPRDWAGDLNEDPAQFGSEDAYGGYDPYDDYEDEQWPQEAYDYGQQQYEGYEDPYEESLDDDGYRELEDRVAGRLAAQLQPYLMPLIQQQAISQLGGASVGRFVEGLPPEALHYIAQHPGLSQALRMAAEAEGHGWPSAPRSEDAFLPDGYMPASVQREYQIAAQVWGDQPWFDARAMRDIGRGGY